MRIEAGVVEIRLHCAWICCCCGAAKRWRKTIRRAAIEHLTALTDHAPDFAEGWHARATAYFRAVLLGPAMDDLQRALVLNPDNFDAVFGLGAH